MVYEWRSYDVVPGREEAGHRRFADHTCALFDKHGIKVYGFWQPEGDPLKIYYLCLFESEQARKDAWASFQADPEWKRVKAESEADGPIFSAQSSVRLIPTSYSAAQ